MKKDPNILESSLVQKPSQQLESRAVSGATPCSRGKRLPRRQIDFMRGYYCCLANILNSHGDNTHISDALHGAGSNDEIIRYADDGDVQALKDAGYLSENDNMEAPNA